MTIVQTLIKAQFVATDAQVEQLARDVTQGKQADGTYLKVLVVACQATLGKSRRKQTTAIDKAHARFYPHIQKGVGNGDLTPRERNRRSTFARTAASALRSFVSRGGNIRTLTLGEVTKARLAAFGRTVPTGTRIERALQRAADAVVRAAKRVARGDPAEAQKRIRTTIEALHDALNGIEVPTPAVVVSKRPRPTADRAHGRRPTVEPILHRSH